MGRIKNKLIRSIARNRHYGIKVRKAPLRWTGQIRRRDTEYIGIRMLEMSCQAEEKRGRPKRKFLGVLKEDRLGADLTEEDAEDGNS